MLTQKSAHFTEEAFELSLDSLNNFLYVKLKLKDKGLKTIPFPKYNNEILKGTAFAFKLLCDGKEIEGAGFTKHGNNSNYFGYGEWLGKGMDYKSDTLDLSYGQTIAFEIPLYAFQKIKAGTHNFEILCSQDLFSSQSKLVKQVVDPAGDSIIVTYRNYLKAPLISFSAKFQLNIPKIFKTTIYGYGIELRNDSVYSPVGMDNTIWNSSYPDVYWTVDFPKNNFYCSSNYQKSTGFYDLLDTFCLYHYTPYDTISIGVWDHDNLSRDDYISYGNFCIGQFPQNKNAKLGFENLKCMELKFDRQGYINK